MDYLIELRKFCSFHSATAEAEFVSTYFAYLSPCGYYNIYAYLAHCLSNSLDWTSIGQALDEVRSWYEADTVWQHSIHYPLGDVPLL